MVGPVTIKYSNLYSQKKVVSRHVGYKGDCKVDLINNTSGTIRKDVSLDEMSQISPEPSVHLGRFSWACLSGWGAALAVGLLAAPAIQSHWFSEEGTPVSSSTVRGVTSSMVVFSLPDRPIKREKSADMAHVERLDASSDRARPLEVPVPSVEEVGQSQATQEATQSEGEATQPVVVASPSVEEAAQPVLVASPSVKATMQQVKTSQDFVDISQPAADPVRPVDDPVPSVDVKPAIPVESVSSVASAPASSAKRTMGWARIQSRPTGADIIVDGAFLGVTPLRFELPSGKYILLLRKQGYQNRLGSFSVATGHPLNMVLELQASLSEPPDSFDKKLPPAPSHSVPVDTVEKKVPAVSVKDVVAQAPVKSGHSESVRQNRKKVPDRVPDEMKDSIPTVLDFNYTIQVGSFLGREGALKEASRLRKKGIDAYVLESWSKKDPSRLWKSVRVGRFQGMSEARAALVQFKNKEKEKGSDAYVTKNDPASKVIKESPRKAAEYSMASAHPNSMDSVEQAAQSALSISLLMQDVDLFIKQKEVSDPPDTSFKKAVAPRELVEKAPVAKEKPEQHHAEDGRGRETVEVLFQRSQALRRDNKITQEEALLRQVLEKDGQHKLALRRLSAILVESDRISEGLSVLKKAVGRRSSGVLVGEDPNLAAFLAALYQRRGEHRKAIDLYRTLLQRFPSKGIWRMGMAISMEKSQKPEQALVAYERALTSSDLSDKLNVFVRQRIKKLKLK